MLLAVFVQTVFATVFFISAAAQSFTPEATRGSNLRGVSAVSDRIVWVSGSNGTVARTTDGGKTWQRLTPPQGAEAFDFRDIEAFSATTAYLMSAGPGEQSRIWKTSDGGKSWRQQYTNNAQDFFLDSLACWNLNSCVALSDPIWSPQGDQGKKAGKFFLLLTDDGEHWHELPRDHLPPALVEKRKNKEGKEEELKEGAFAASGTAIAVLGKHIWFGTGGPKARVFHSADRGQTWTVAETPIMHGEPSQGIFSIAFRDAKHGMIVGGDYKQPDKTGANAAISDDGGKTWNLISSNELPYCSAARLDPIPTHALAVGLQGAFDILRNDKDVQVHQTDRRAFNAISRNWLVGPSGTVVHVVPVRKTTRKAAPK